MNGVASALSENEERGFILECVDVYKSLPALWDVKFKEYSNRQRKKTDTYAVLRNKYPRATGRRKQRGRNKKKKKKKF